MTVKEQRSIVIRVKNADEFVRGISREVNEKYLLKQKNAPFLKSLLLILLKFLLYSLHPQIALFQKPIVSKYKKTGMNLQS